MSQLSKISLIGSCRLQDIFTRIYPPRLHSAAEIYFFLKNLEEIKRRILTYNNKILDGNTCYKQQLEKRILCTMHGDCAHNLIRKDVKLFWEKRNLFFQSNIYMIEISSTSYLKSGHVIGSTFYNKKYKVFIEKNSSAVETSLAEFKEQIYNIYTRLQEISHQPEAIKLFLIPVCDLPLNGLRIEKRENLSNLLSITCQELNNVEYCPIWDDLRSISNIDLSTVMKDKHHYSKPFLNFIYQYLDYYFQYRLNTSVKTEVQFYRNTYIKPSFFDLHESFFGRYSLKN